MFEIESELGGGSGEEVGTGRDINKSWWGLHIVQPSPPPLVISMITMCFYFFYLQRFLEPGLHTYITSCNLKKICNGYI